MLDGREIGVVGELHPLAPKWGATRSRAPILFKNGARCGHRAVPVAQPVPKQQPVERDLAW